MDLKSILALLATLLGKFDEGTAKTIYQMVVGFVKQVAAKSSTVIDDAVVDWLDLQASDAVWPKVVAVAKAILGGNIPTPPPIVMGSAPGAVSGTAGLVAYADKFGMEQFGVALGPEVGELVADLEALPKAIDPATIQLIIQLALTILSFFKK